MCASRFRRGGLRNQRIPTLQEQRTEDWTMAMDEDDEGVDFPDSQCLKETERAILVTRGKGYLWIPKSVIHDDSEVYEDGHEGTLIVQTWWAEEKNLL
jgi:hypothetical protein